MLPTRSRSAPAVLAFLLTLLIAAPAAAQTVPSEERQAAEDALADAQRLADGHGIRTGRELTTALLEVARRRGALSRSDRTEADSLLGRPTDPGDTLQTAGPYTVPEQTPACSDHFCVHWVRDAPTGDQPSNVNTDTDGDTIPDYVEWVVDASEASYAKEITDLGWQPPKSDGLLGGNPKTDIYIKDLNPGSAKGLYGYANTDSPQSGRSRYGFVVVDNDYNDFEFGGRYSGDPRPAIDVTVAHEFNHVLQFNYDMAQDGWMYEATATWMEDKVFPAVDDYLIYVGDWIDVPELPLTTADGSKEYGSAVWNHWLDGAFGEDTIRDAWAGSASPANTVDGGGFAPQAFDSAIKGHGGAGFQQAFGEFAMASSTWDVPDSGFHEGGLYGDVHRSTLLPDGALRSPELDHTAYAVYDVPVPAADRLDLAVALPSGTSGYVALIGDDGATVTRSAHTLAAGGGTTVSLPNPGGFSRITAVVANTDVQQDGYEPSCGDDWNWSRDAQTANLRLSAHAAGDPTSAPPATPAAHISDCTPAVTPAPSPTPTPAPSATATPGTTPPPTVTPTPPVDPPVATSLRLTRNSSRISSVLRKGVLSLFAQANKAGRHSARATVDRTTARRLKVGRRTTTAGSGSRTASSPARLKVDVKLTRKLRAALQRNRKRSLKLKVAVTFTPADGTAAVRQTLTITLRP